MQNRNKADSSFEAAAMRIIIQPLIDEELKAFDAYNTIPHEYSPEFHTKLKKLLNRHRIINFSRSAGLWCKRVAVCLMLIVTIAFVSCAAIEPLREKIADAFITWYSEYVDIHFSPENTGSPVMKKEIFVPEGYTLLHEVEKNDHYIARYMNTSNELLSYAVTPHNQKEKGFDIEHHTIETVSLSTVDGIFFLGKSGYENMLTWSINGYDYTITGFLTLDEMKKMIGDNQ